MNLILIRVNMDLILIRVLFGPYPHQSTIGTYKHVKSNVENQTQNKSTKNIFSSYSDLLVMDLTSTCHMK